jgi:hypothetical protein
LDGLKIARAPVRSRMFCLGDGPAGPNPVCLTKSQLAALLSQSGMSSATPTDAPPTIQVNGANQAIIHVGFPQTLDHGPSRT